MLKHLSSLSWFVLLGIAVVSGPYADAQSIKLLNDDGVEVVASSTPDGVDAGINESIGWLSEVEKIRNQLAPDQFPDLGQAETHLLDRITATRSYFRRASSDENYDAWMRYLDWMPLIEAIEAGESVALRGRGAVDLRSRMRGVVAGLELSEMVSLRESLDRYIVALGYSNPKVGLKRIESLLNGMIDILSPKVATPPTKAKLSGPALTGPSLTGPAKEESGRSVRSWRDLVAEDRDKLEWLLGRLVAVGQAEDLAARIRKRFSQPNVHIWINGNTITDAIARPVNKPSDVDDCILGTRLLGDARVDGKVTAELLPQDGYVRICLRLDGRFTTSTRGFRKPITLDSTGVGQVYAARQMAITERKVILGETVATADLSTKINRINHPLRIVRKIAARKAQESKPRAEQISESRLRQRILDDFDSETAETANRSFPDIDEEIRPWLQRLDFPEITRTIGSTDQAVFVRASMQRRWGFAAANPPASPWTIRNPVNGAPVLSNGTACIQIHQSIVGNTLGQLLSGETYTPKRIDRIAEVLDISLSEVDRGTLDRQDEPEEFEVDFGDLRPVYIEVENQSLRIGIRGDRFSQGDQEFDRPLEISAVYRPVQGPGGKVWLVRDEEINVSSSSTRRLTITQTARKTNVEEGFKKLLPKELLQRDFQIPDSWGLPALAGRQLSVRSIDLSDGWISVTVH